MINTNLRTVMENLLVVHPALAVDQVIDMLKQTGFNVKKMTHDVHDKLLAGKVNTVVETFSNMIKKTCTEKFDAIVVTDFPYHDDESFTLFFTAPADIVKKFISDASAIGGNPALVKTLLDKFKYRIEDTFLFPTEFLELANELEHRLKFLPSSTVVSKVHAVLTDKTNDPTKDLLILEGVGDAAGVLNGE